MGKIIPRAQKSFQVHQWQLLDCQCRVMTVIRTHTSTTNWSTAFLKWISEMVAAREKARRYGILSHRNSYFFRNGSIWSWGKTKGKCHVWSLLLTDNGAWTFHSVLCVCESHNCSVSQPITHCISYNGHLSASGFSAGASEVEMVAVIS